MYAETTFLVPLLLVDKYSLVPVLYPGFRRCFEWGPCDVSDVNIIVQVSTLFYHGLVKNEAWGGNKNLSKIK